MEPSFRRTRAGYQLPVTRIPRHIYLVIGIAMAHIAAVTAPQPV